MEITHYCWCRPQTSALLTKTLRIMRITAIFLFVISLHVSARTAGQTITIKETNAPLRKVLRDIHRQTGMEFFYQEELVSLVPAITIDVKNEPLSSVLQKCFGGLPFSYTIEGKAIYLKKVAETKAPPAALDASAQSVTVTGRVVDEKGQLLAGASVSVKKGRQGTITNEKGMFELKNVPSGATLEVSFLGFQKQEVTIDGLGPVTIRLVASNSQLDETQVIAYGQTSQRMSVGDVTTIKGADIEKQPVSNLLEALEGRVPGMQITQATGVSGSGVTVQVRGQNNIVTSFSGNDPLYVIDGVPYPSQLLPGINGIFKSSGATFSDIVGSPMSFINPSEIESISVLKDADATAIYGSRAASGAILITTKKGKSGNTTVNLNLQTGLGQVPRKLPLLKTPEYLRMRHEAFNNDGLAPQPYDYDVNGTWDTTTNTDWQKVMLGGMAQYNNLDGTVSGGNSNVTYLIGATFHRETTVFSNDFSDQKGAVHFSVKGISTNQKFQIQLSGNYMIDNNQLPGSDLTTAAVTAPPDQPSLYTKDGQLNWAPDQNGNSTLYNPLMTFLNGYKNKTSNLIGNSSLSYLILPGLNLSASLGYTNLQSAETLLFPLTMAPPEQRSTSTRVAYFGNNDINSWIVEPQLSYKHKWGKAGFDILAGSTINQQNSNGLQFQAFGQPSDAVLPNIQSATNLKASLATVSVYKYNAAFGRISFNWDDKYLFNISGRRDGSSRFGSANQFHDFGSMGGAWIFSNESFFQKMNPALSFGKIRVTYGSTGGDQVGDYQYLNLYTLRNYPSPYQNSVSLAPNGLVNPYLQWEETKKLETGIDLGFLKDRILLTASHYRNRSSEQLLPYSLPIITGYGSILRNLPATVQNQGWELLLTTANIRTKNFTWSSTINLTVNNNKLLSYPNYAGVVYLVGQPLNYYRAYHYVGVDPATGLYQFSDGKGGLTSSPDTSYLTTATKIIKLSPSYYGGFSNSLRYKNIQLDFLFQFVKQNGADYAHGAAMPGAFGNQPKWVLGRWQKPGDIAGIQRFTTGYDYANPYNDVLSSDAAYKDASYIRLKNLSFSYQLPQKLIRQAHLQNLRLYALGQNLLTITRYKGLDPETLSSTSLPPLRVFTFGIQAAL